MGDELAIHLIVALIGGTIGAAVASSKGRSVVGWFFLCFFFPLIGIIIIACMPNLKRERERQEQIAMENRRLREQLRQERIKAEAFRAHTSARLDTHDQVLGIDTRAPQALPGGSADLPRLMTQVAGVGGQSPATGAPGSSPDTLWHYEVNGQAVGPVSQANIHMLLRSGRINAQTLVWCEDLAEWTPLGQVPALLSGGAR